jgi:hypothetical protein
LGHAAIIRIEKLDAGPRDQHHSHPLCEFSLIDRKLDGDR